MILKLILLAAVIFLVYKIFFKKTKKVQTKKDLNIEDEMFQCPSCSTFVSQREAILSNGKYYCSKECLK